MDIEFRKRRGGGSVALIDRPDCVRLRLTSYDRKSAVPHDLAHLVAERAFRLTGGLWGSIAAGAVFAGMEVVSGQLRHDRRARSDAVRRTNASELGLAEVLVGVVHRGVDQDDRTIVRELRGAWDVFRPGPCPFPGATAVDAVAELRGLAERWKPLPLEAALALTWPLGRR